jgi:hypothetical protein
VGEVEEGEKKEGEKEEKKEGEREKEKERRRRGGKERRRRKGEGKEEEGESRVQNYTSFIYPWTGGVTQEVEHLLCKHEVLSSIPSYEKK